MVKLICRLGPRSQKIVEVDISQPVSVLAEKLNITDRETKFMYNWETFCIYGAYTFEDIGLKQDNRIFINNQSISGGGVSTVDVSKNKTKILGLTHDPNAKFYEYVTRGLNIKSECKNRSCEAYNNRIYIQIGYVTRWNLLDNLREKVRCPNCKERVKPLNFGFWDCRYEIEYEKETENGYEENTVSGEAGADDFKIFDNENDKADFTRLIFNIYTR
jgi:ribosomal protein L37AE/L43A